MKFKWSATLLFLLIPFLAGASNIDFSQNPYANFTSNDGYNFLGIDDHAYCSWAGSSYLAFASNYGTYVIITMNEGSTTFTLNSIDIIGTTWNFNMTIEGYNGASLVQSQSVTVNSSSWKTYSLSGFTGINKIKIINPSNYSDPGIDNIDFTVPNAAPTDISLSSTTIPNGAPSGTTVGTFSTTDAHDSGAHTYTFASGGTDNASFTISGDELKTAFVSDVYTKSVYNIKIRVTDSGALFYEENMSVTVEDVYPAIDFTDQEWDYITNVTFNTINNTTEGTGGGYKNYTNFSTTVNKLETYTLIVTNPPTEVIDPSYPENIKAWIDWNRNNSFDDAGEAFEVGSNLTTQQACSLNVQVPNTASEGNTRMRVAILGASPATYPANSGTQDYGEAEDYTVQIGAALPVELISFNVKIDNNNILLDWITATEINNYGFEIEKKSIDAKASSLGHYEWGKIGFVEGCGNSNSVKEYSFIDKEISAGVYNYRLKQIDIDGSYSYSKEIEINVGSIIDKFAIEQNFPNPFNPVTNIKYSIPNSEFVSLRIYDVLGNEVIVLVNERKEPGSYTVEFDGSNLTSGVYFYRLNCGSFTEVKKMALLK